MTSKNGVEGALCTPEKCLRQEGRVTKTEFKKLAVEAGLSRRAAAEVWRWYSASKV